MGKNTRLNKSKVIEYGYINTYSELNKQEKRQLLYNREYKTINPKWDNTMIMMCNYFIIAKLALQKKLKVLDAGCGHGNYVIDEFRNDISQAIGIDIDKNSTRKNICLDEITHSNLNKMPYESNRFDVVLSFWVIEHLESPLDVYNEIFRILNNNGYFIFCTTNKNFLPIKIKRLIRSSKINNFINNIVYGRKDEDIFKTEYKSNTIFEIKEFLDLTGFKEIDVKLNYDPGYTSFCKVSFYK